MTAAPATTLDGFLDHRLLIRQPASGAHRAGLDAVLLAASVPSAARGHVVDLGAGVGVAGLAVAARLTEVRVTLVEIDPVAAALARANGEENAAAVGDRAAVVEGDALVAVGLAAAGLGTHSADVTILNPPFHPADRGRPSPAAARALAHLARPDDLSRWLTAAARLTHPKGLMVMIHRADELARILGAIGTRFGSLEILPVHPREGEPAHRLIVRGRPQGRAPLKLLPGFMLHEADGRFTAAADAVLRGGGLDAAFGG